MLATLQPGVSRQFLFAINNGPADLFGATLGPSAGFASPQAVFLSVPAMIAQHQAQGYAPSRLDRLLNRNNLYVNFMSSSLFRAGAVAKPRRFMT